MKTRVITLISGIGMVLFIATYAHAQVASSARAGASGSGHGRGSGHGHGTVSVGNRSDSPEHGKQSMKAVGQFSNGVTVSITTYVESPDAPNAPKVPLAGGIQVGNNIIHRDIRFQDNARYGYDLEVEPIGDGRQFKVSFAPFSPKAAQRLRERRWKYNDQGAEARWKSTDQAAAETTVLSLPRLPEPLTIEEGDMIELEVLVNPQTGVRVIDLIKVTRNGEGELNKKGASAKSGVSNK
jgi:hypothetical protein